MIEFIFVSAKVFSKLIWAPIQVREYICNLRTQTNLYFLVRRLHAERKRDTHTRVHRRSKAKPVTTEVEGERLKTQVF